METSVNLDDDNVKKSRKRLANLELLRIISMLLITCVHLLNYAGYLENATNGAETFILRILYCFFVTSVNVFVIIFAYFNINKEFKLKRIVKLWIMVVYYSVVLYLISYLFFGSEFSLKDFGTRFFPILHNNYWFFTAYIVTFLISPFLNLAINNASKKQLQISMLVIIGFSILALKFPIDNVVRIDYGYNIIWFMCLYVVGAYLKKYPLKIKNRYLVIIYLLSLASILVSYYIGDSFICKVIRQRAEYTSFATLIASISIFSIFCNFNISNEKAISSICIISSASFGVYLFQEAMAFKPIMYFNILRVQNHYGQITSFLWIILFAVLIYIMGFVFDLIRQYVFKLCSKLFIKIKNKKN